jgi:hypothetical protein
MPPIKKGFKTAEAAKAANQGNMTDFFKPQRRKGRPKKRATLPGDSIPDNPSKKKQRVSVLMPSRKKSASAKEPVENVASVLAPVKRTRPFRLLRSHCNRKQTPEARFGQDAT